MATKARSTNHLAPQDRISLPETRIACRRVGLGVISNKAAQSNRKERDEGKRARTGSNKHTSTHGDERLSGCVRSTMPPEASRRLPGGTQGRHVPPSRRQFPDV
jgi:hypothetical protein